MEDVRETRALCKWNKPKDDGGTELKGYVVEKMDVDTGRWVPAGEVSFEPNRQIAPQAQNAGLVRA